jgi:MoaA/NifB/PqqE/SkfB family radical SAM enzyme
MNQARLALGYLNYKLFRKGPLYATYNVTFRCNSRCEYCEYWRSSWPELNTNESVTVIKRIAESGARMLDFSGGEPTLRNDIGDLITLSNDLGLFTTMNTNGLAIRNDMMNKFRAGLEAITISLDGPEEIHDKVRGIPGGYRKAIQSIKTYRESGIRTGISTVLSTQNRGKIKSMISDVIDIVDFITVQPQNPPTGIPPDPDDLRAIRGLGSKLIVPNEYLQQIEHYSTNKFAKMCDAMELYFSVDPEGYLNPCPQRSDIRIGKLTDHSYHELVDKYYPAFKDKVSACSGCYLACTVALSMQMKESITSSAKIALRTYFNKS